MEKFIMQINRLNTRSEQIKICTRCGQVKKCFQFDYFKLMTAKKVKGLKANSLINNLIF